MSLRLAAGILAISMIAFPAIAFAQDNGQDTTDLKTHTATGCLQRSAATNSYTMTDENGKLWNLRSNTVSFDAHVGHTVTVSGTIPKESKNSTDTSPQNNLLVTKLDMVRDSCKQP